MLLRTMSWLAAALLIGLSGCAETMDTEDAMGVDTDDGLNATANATDLAPVLVFTSDVANGTAPLNVTFSLDLLNVTDATGAGWTITLGDEVQEGAGLPATATFALDAGEHTAQASVIYDQVRYDASLDISVAEGAPPAGTYLTDVSFAEEGTVLVGTQGVDACGASPDYDTVSHTLTVPGDHEGTAAAVGHVYVHIAFEDPNSQDLDMTVYDPSGAVVGGSAAFNALDQDYTETVDKDVELPGGDYVVKVVGCTGVAMDYSLDATFTLVTV